MALHSVAALLDAGARVAGQYSSWTRARKKQPCTTLVEDQTEAIRREA
jgi:hypothetical protein